MANDKKFIVKNGLETEGDVLIGGVTDDGISKLQTEGAVKFTATFPSYPTLHVINNTGTADSPIVEFEGPSGALSIRNIDTNDFGIFNGTQAAGSGIEFHQGGAGNGELILKRAGSEVLSFSNGNTSFTGLSTTNIEGRRIITTDDQASQGGSFDAATLDGLDSTQFVRSDENDTMDGSYIITGNLTVQGVTTSINSEVVTIADNILQLNSNVTGAPTENSGIEIVRGTSDNVSLIWNETSDWWSVGTYSFESDEIRSTDGSDLSLRAASSSSANVNITAGFGSNYIGLKSVFTGSEGYGEVLYGNDAKLQAVTDGILIGENLDVNGDITVGDNSNAAQINFDGVGINRTIYSNNGEIGFLKGNLNYGAYLNTNEDWIVAGNNEVQGNIVSEGDITAKDDIFADGDITSNNNITATNGNITASAGAVTAQTSVTAITGNVTAAAGNVTAGNDVTAANDVTALAGDVTAGQDVIATRDITAGRNAAITGDLTANNAYITNDLTADDIISQTINANSAIIGDITANNITADQDIRSGRFVDNDDDTYYFDGDKTTVANTIGIDTELFHNGDTDTKLRFETDQVDFYAGSNTPKLRVENTKVTSVEIHAPLYYDSDDTNYYLNPAASSVLSNIYIDDYILHNGDADTYFGFSADDQFRVTTGNNLGFLVTNSVVRAYNEMRAPSFKGELGGTTNFLDFESNTSGAASLAVSGVIQVGNTSDYDRMDDTTGTGGVTINPAGGIQVAQSGVTGTEANKPSLGLNRISMGFNPFAASNRFITFAATATNGQHVAGDSAGNLNFIPDQDTTAIKFWNSSADNVFTINHGGDVVVGGETASYASSDATASVGAINANKLHVQGSIQLNRDDDAIVLGRSTSGFLKNNELKFGLGGGFYQAAAATITVHGGKDLATTGDMYAGRFYDDDDNNYYIDAAGDSQLNTIDIDDSIRHRGDLTTLIGFPNADQFEVKTNNVQRLLVENSKATFSIPVYAPRYYDSQNNSYYVDPASTSIMNRIDIDDFIRHNGDTNTYFGFSAADTFRIFTGGSQRVNVDNNSVDFSVNDTGTNAYRNIYYDNNDTAFYIDGNSESRLNTLRLRKTGDPANDFNALWIDNGTGATGDIDTPESWVNFQFEDSNANFKPQVRIGATTGYNDGTSSDTQDKEGSGNFIVQTAEGTGGAGAGALATTFYVNYRGDAYAKRSMRSPIFYDQDNDSFFGNFASESRMATIKLDDGVVLRSPNGTYGSFAIDGQARGGWEGFSIGDRSVFMHDNANRTGLFNDVDDQWFLYADRQNSLRFMYNGVEQARTENGYFLANNQMHSPIYYDSNNTSFYLDPASTSITNTMRANRYQVEGSTYYIDVASGDYGSIRVEGAKNGWAGYAIRDDWVFMANGPSEAGIYNDTNNEWAIKFFQNNRAEIMYNGGIQARTQSNHFDMINQARAPIYYDRNNTGYYGDFASHSRMNSVSFGNQGAIANSTYAMSAYHNNRYLLGLRYSGANSDYPWIVHDNWNGYDGTNRSSFIIHFNGVADRFHFDSQGNFKAAKSVTAPEINLNGGNGNLNLSPAYGSGVADSVLFDATEYFDKRVINPLAPNENSLTTTTSEFVRATTGPFAGSYVLQTSANRDFYTAYMPVEPGEELYGEMSVRRISGSGGVVYYGIERYDQNLSPIASNSGTTYFVVSGANQTSTSWQTYRGYTTIPSNCYYVRIRVLMNYSSGGALRQYAGIMLKRSNYHGRLRGDDIIVSGDVTADRYYDNNNTAFYLDPASTSILNDVRGSIFYDRDNTSYYVNPASTSRIANIDIAPTLSNGQARIRSIMSGGYPALEFSDSAPGNSSGDQHFVWGANDVNVGRMELRFRGGTAFGSAWYNEGTVLASFIGDNNAVEFPQSAGVRTPILYDYNNTSYYVDPASTSRMVHMRLSSGDSYLKIGSNAATQTTRDTNRPQIEIGANNAYPHFTLSSWGTNTTHGGVMSFRSRLNSSNNVRRWNIGTANYQANSIQIGYFDNQENPHYGVGVNGWTYDSYSRFVIYTGYSEARGSMRAPIFYDVNNTGYYGDFASTSRMNAINYNNIYAISGGVAHFYTSSGSLRGYIQATESNDAHLKIATSGGEDIQFLDGGLGGQWNMIIRGDGDVLTNRNHYAQIFYDRNNSGYYLNPNGTSRLGTVRVDRIDMADRGDFITFYGDDSTYHSISSRDNGGGVTDDLRFNSYHDIFFNLDSNNNNSSGTTGFYVGQHGAATGSIAGWYFQAMADGNSYASSSFRAPIFYDRNNTGYYADPASTSRFNTLRTNRLYTGYDSSTDDYLDYPTSDYGSVQVNGGGKNGWEGYNIAGRYNFMSADNNQVGIYNDIDNEWMWYGERNGRTYFYYNGRWEARTDSGYFRAERQMRAPIYYDLNNTGYYGDFAGTSVFNTVNFNGKAFFKARQNDSAGSHSSYDVTGTDYLNNVAAEFWSGNDAPVTIYFRSGVNAPSDHGYITFDPDFNNTGENAAMVIGVDNDGTGSSDYIRLQGRVELHSNLSSSDNSEMQGWWYQTTKYARLNTDYFDHISDIRSPIFYDRNNTGYYADPASTSRFNTLRTNRLYFAYDNDTDVYFDYPTGNYGSVQVNGSGRGDWEGYSIRGEYVFMSADSGQVGIYNDVDNEWMLYANRNSHLYQYYNGRWETRTENGWFRVERSSRSPIFYDLNNTGYYFNGASTSRSNYHRLNNAYDSQERRFFAPDGGTYTTSSSSVNGACTIYLPTNRRGGNTMLHFTVNIYEYNTGRMTQFRIGGYAYSSGRWTNVSATQISDSDDAPYIVRFCDDGSRHMVCIGSTGDNWTYPQVQVVDVHTGYSSFSTNWGSGWSVGFRTTNYGTQRTTRTASYMLGTNNRTNWNTDLRATIFYDRNNTAYYVDPASTSRLANITANFIQWDNGFDIYDDDADTISLRSNNSDHGELIFRDSNSTACGRIYWDDDGQHFGLKHANNEWAVYMYENSYTYLYYNGRWEARADSGYWRAERSSRAPLFYDLNSTAYYVNPASDTSMRLNGGIHFGATNAESRGGFIGRHGSNSGGLNTDRYPSPGYSIGYNYRPSGTGLSNHYGYGYAHTNSPFFSLSGQSGWGFYVSADGDARVQLSGSNGAVSATGNIVAYASDGRLKENVTPITAALEKLHKIRGVEYDWVENIKEEYDFHPTKMHEVGVIAQEVEEVLPEVVNEAPFNANYNMQKARIAYKEFLEERDDKEWDKKEAKEEFEKLTFDEQRELAAVHDQQYLTVDYERITSLLIEAVKEVDNKYKEEVSSLRNEIAELKKLILNK